jgi:hypothetical protein
MAQVGTFNAAQRYSGAIAHLERMKGQKVHENRGKLFYDGVLHLESMLKLQTVSHLATKSEGAKDILETVRQAKAKLAERVKEQRGNDPESQKMHDAALDQVSAMLDSFNSKKIETVCEEMFKDEFVDKTRYDRLIAHCAESMQVGNNSLFESEHINGKPIFKKDGERYAVDIDAFNEFAMALGTVERKTEFGDREIDDEKKRYDREKAEYDKQFGELSTKKETVAAERKDLLEQMPWLQAIEKDREKLINVGKEVLSIFDASQNIVREGETKISKNAEIVSKNQQILKDAGDFKDFKSYIEKLNGDLAKEKGKFLGGNKKIVAALTEKIQTAQKAGDECEKLWKENHDTFAEIHDTHFNGYKQNGVKIAEGLLKGEFTKEQIEEIRTKGMSDEMLQKVSQKIEEMLPEGLPPFAPKGQGFQPDRPSTSRYEIKKMLLETIKNPNYNIDGVKKPEELKPDQDGLSLVRDVQNMQSETSGMERIAKTIREELKPEIEKQQQYDNSNSLKSVRVMARVNELYDYEKRYDEQIAKLDNPENNRTLEGAMRGGVRVTDAVRFRDKYMNNDKLKAEVAVLRQVIAAEDRSFSKDSREDLVDDHARQAELYDDRGREGQKYQAAMTDMNAHGRAAIDKIKAELDALIAANQLGNQPKGAAAASSERSQ